MSHAASITPKAPPRKTTRAALKAKASPAKTASAVKKPVAKKAAVVRERWQQIIARATNTFGSQERALAWLKRPSDPLNNRTPQSLLTTDEGLQQVEQLLGQIDHGIAA